MAARAVKQFLTDEQVAIILGINPRTWLKWLHAYPEFRRAVARSKVETDQVIEASLVRRAQGYSVEAEKLIVGTEVRETVDRHGRKVVERRSVPVVGTYNLHIPAEVPAIALWLHNRSPDRWHKSGSEAAPTVVVIEDAERRAAAFDRLAAMLTANARAGGEPVIARLAAPVAAAPGKGRT